MKKTTLKNTIIEEIKVEDKVCGLSVVAVSNDNQYKILQITDKKIRGIFPTSEDMNIKINKSCPIYNQLNAMIDDNPGIHFIDGDTDTELLMIKEDDLITFYFGGQISMSTLEDDSKMYESTVQPDEENEFLLKYFIYSYNSKNSEQIYKVNKKNKTEEKDENAPLKFQTTGGENKVQSEKQNKKTLKKTDKKDLKSLKGGKYAFQ